MYVLVSARREWWPPHGTVKVIFHSVSQDWHSNLSFLWTCYVRTLLQECPLCHSSGSTHGNVAGTLLVQEPRVEWSKPGTKPRFGPLTTREPSPEPRKCLWILTTARGLKEVGGFSGRHTYRRRWWGLAMVLMLDKERGRRVSKLGYDPSFSKYSAKTLSYLVSEARYQCVYGSHRAPETTSSSPSNPVSLLPAATDWGTVSGHGFSSLMRHIPFVFHVPYKGRALC